MRTSLRITPLLLLLLVASACTNPSTPEGHEGYIYHVPVMFGKADYRDSMVGPASTGVSWRLYVTNVDMRAKSYKEEFSLLTSDNLKIDFEANTRLRLRPHSVREVVEQWGGDDWYTWRVKEPARTIVRREVTNVRAVDIQLQTDVVRGRIYEAMLEKYKGTPVEVMSVDIGNIKFPPRVTAAIETKIAKHQELLRQKFLLEKTRKDAAILVLDALRVAKQQQIISSTLDPLYVQRRAVEVYKRLAQSNNKTIMMLPNSSDGTAMPLVHSQGRRKILTPADEQLLADMEERYMKIASGKKTAGDTTVPMPVIVPAVDPAAVPTLDPAAVPAGDGATGAEPVKADGAD